MRKSSTKLSIALTTTILSAALFTAPITWANDSLYTYNPTAEVTTKFSKGRNIAELNYMQPFLSTENQLPIIDLKLKIDNKKSKEINLGLVYRYNYEDNLILGTYAYFDHRRTASNFSISGLTAGVEVLSKYIDARANIYIPQSKRKKLSHNGNKTVEIKGTSIFAISGGHKYESALRGYDIEVGTPLFAFSDSLNEQFGTKVFVARYSFSGKNVKAINGTRFRMEQTLGTMWAGDNSYKFHASAETQFDKIRKRQNFIGLGMKVAFNDKKNSYKKKPSGLKHRMMETVIRDVDIVTESVAESPTRHSFHMNGKEVKKIYYVGSAQEGYSGDGTKNNPISLEQMNNLNCDDAIIVITTIDPNKGGTDISRQDYTTIKKMPQVINGKKQVVLATTGADRVSLTIKDENGISITNDDQKNTKIVIDNNQKIPITAQTSTIQLLELDVNEAINNQIQVARIAEQEEIAQADAQVQAELAAFRTQIAQANAQALADNQALANAQAEAARFGIAPILEYSPEQALLVNEAARRILAEAANRDEAIIEGEAELALQPEGTVISGIDRDRLSPVQKELYDLIANCKVCLQASEPENHFVKRQLQYDAVNAIIQAHQGDNLASIENRIDQEDNLTFRDKLNYKYLASRIMDFNGVIEGNAIGGGQQGIGFSHTGPKDIAIATSLEKLRDKYGILDGDIAIDLAKNMITKIIQDKIPNIGPNVGITSLQHDYIAPTELYKSAAMIYLGNLNPPAAGETQQEKADRLSRKANAKTVIDHEVKSSLTAVNENMAAYRAIDRAGNVERDRGIRQIFTEHVLGRYNDREMLAYIILANLDVSEIQKNLQIANKPLTPSNIFASQKENLNGLIHQLGDGQRAYNMDHINGIIDVGGIPGLARPLYDLASCSHGYCTRIMSSAMHHSDVNLSEASPASLMDEFRFAVAAKAAKLDQEQKNAIKTWVANVADYTVTIDITPDREVTFSTPAAEGQVDIPLHYKNILTDVAGELDSRYNFTHPNHKIQLVKENEARNVFEYTHSLNLGF